VHAPAIADLTDARALSALVREERDVQRPDAELRTDGHGLDALRPFRRVVEPNVTVSKCAGRDERSGR
jgi:hypothetical protein